METETKLLLKLDERNLAQFLSALALASLARRVQVDADAIRTIEYRRCWWPKPGQFAIETELPAERFRAMLFATAHEFLKAMKWHPGFGGAANGILVSGSEIGVNPFISLSGDATKNTPLKGFSARVVPGATLPQQLAKLQPPDRCPDWLEQLDRGANSWGFDSRVNMHASDAGISSDAEGSGHLDPLYPAVEVLGLAAAAFFAPAHAWHAERNAILATAWTQPVLLSMAALAATARIHGLAARRYKFAYRGAAHGKGGSYHFFPPATMQPSTP